MQQISCSMLSFHCAVSDVQGETGWKATYALSFHMSPSWSCQAAGEQTHVTGAISNVACLYEHAAAAAAARARWLVVISPSVWTEPRFLCRDPVTSCGHGESRWWFSKLNYFLEVRDDKQFFCMWKPQRYHTWCRPMWSSLASVKHQMPAFAWPTDDCKCSRQIHAMCVKTTRCSECQWSWNGSETVWQQVETASKEPRHM